MFSPLARGKAGWDGGVEFEEYSDQTSPIEPLFPQLLNRTSPGNKSAKSTGSAVLDDGQLALPKTFVTRKGAILLFTPSDDLCNHGNGESHRKKENVYEAGLKLRTLGNLTNSVLEFGKEDEEAWEGILDSPKEKSQKESLQKRDKTLFLRFLHYLDSENLTADKHVQPGADPDYYLEELKKSSGHNSQRRFRSQTPFSAKTSHSSNTYSHFLEDDQEITSIIEDYMKYGSRTAGWAPNKEHLEYGVISSDHMPDINIEGCEASEDLFVLSSPRSPRIHHNHITFSPSMPAMSGSPFYEGEYLISRPKTAPIPPTLESPRANPRITSAKPPPATRALGSTPSHLDEIINADVGFGRYQRQGPRRRLSRSPSPSFHPGSSRGGTPDFTKAQRLASPDGKSEEWNRTSHVIEEEDEVSIPMDQEGSGKGSRRPSSAGTLSSGSEGKVSVQRRASSAGTANRKSRSSAHSSRSASLSSVSQHFNRTLSAMSHDQEHDFREFEDIERDGNLPTWPGMRDEFSSFQNELVDGVARSSTGQFSRDIADSRTVSSSRDNVMSPSRDNVMSHSRDSSIKSLSPPPKGSSVISRVASPSTRSPSVQSRRGKEARSRSSSAASSDANELWEEAVKAAEITEERKSTSASSRERTVSVSRQSDQRQEDDQEESETRISSAKSANGGAETKATLGSETDLAQVAEAVVRSQSVVEGLYEDLLAEEETADQEWPGQMAGAEESKHEEMNASDDNDSILQDLAISSVDGPAEGSPEGTFLPIPRLSAEESSDSFSYQQATPPNATERGEKKRQETPVIEVHEDESVTSLHSLELLENETTPSVTLSVESDKTEVVVMKPETSGTVITDKSSTDIQNSTTSAISPTNLPVDVPESKHTALATPEIPAKRQIEVPRGNSPAPIKADQILHKELLTETGLQVEGKVDDRRPPSPYKETIDIEKSRPPSPVTEEQRNVPVSIGEAVRDYLVSGKEPQFRERSTRSRRGSETGVEEEENATKAAEKIIASDKEAEEPMNRSKPEVAKTTISGQSKPAVSSLSEKSKDLSGGKRKAATKPDLPGLSLVNRDDKSKEVKEPTDEEREARRQMVSSLFSNQDAPTRGKLELEGIGKEGEDGESTSEGLVTRTSTTIVEKKKNDLSDLASLVSKNKTPSKPKEKKPESKKKSGKPSKAAKKKSEIIIDPENIDFDAFNTPEMLDGMDDELRQFIQEQNKSDVTSATATQPSDDAVVSKQMKRQESVQMLEVPQVALEVPPENRDAYAPSKQKKLSKKELTKMRADQRKEERKRKEEEKRLKEEEIRLLKEREEEAAIAKAESEEKQKNIEEEKMKRMEEEEEAKKQEQEALEKLKDAKKKAREERESRRAAEAERRRLEVQKKREEKKKREEDLKEREKELDQQRMDREKRMAEIGEARRRKDELERLEDEQRLEEERLRALQEEEEDRLLEEEKIHEAEEELRRIQEEREYREQMRRIAEIQEAKLRQEEEERRRREEEESQQIEKERCKRQEAEQKRVREEQKRIEMARRLEALARMRSAAAAARRKALLLKRREDNVERMQNLKHSRCGQHVTRAFVFTYYTHIPRKVWEVPIGFNKKKKGYGPPRRKPAPPKPP